MPHNHSNTDKTQHKIYSNLFDSKHNAPHTNQRITQGNEQKCAGDQPKKVCLLLFVKKVDKADLTGGGGLLQSLGGRTAKAQSTLDVHLGQDLRGLKGQKLRDIGRIKEVEET